MKHRFEDFELVGKYVRLTPLLLEHAPALSKAAMLSRNTFQYTLVPTDLASTESYIEQRLINKANGIDYPFATIDQKSGKIVGATRFMSMEYWKWPQDSLHKKKQIEGIPDVVEIGGTWICEPFQRSAINTEAKILMLTHAFEKWKVQRVMLKTDSKNEKSRRNIERIGAKLDGILRAHMPSFDTGIRDTAFYSMLASEWPEAKEKLIDRLK